MIFIILIIIVVLIYFYKFYSDRNKMLSDQVDQKGGMIEKYNILTDSLLNSYGTRIVQVKRDHIHILVDHYTTIYDFLITENFNSVEIKWIGRMDHYGEYKHKWTFPHNYPQEKMIDEIGEFLVWKTDQITGDI